MTVKIVMGGQFGSEGKGSVTSWLSANEDFDLVIRTGAPNAGHTFIDPNGDRRIMRMLPCSWAFQETPLYLPSGCLIDLDVLWEEMSWLHDWKFRAGIFISPYAAIIEEDAKDREKGISTGTTGKGVGATRAKECLREAIRASNVEDLIYLSDEDDKIQSILNNPDSNILIESTQGFGLSMDYKYYPYCTSTNLMPYQILQDADIPYGIHDIEVWMVLRTFPIRIAGNSGILHGETTWDRLRDTYGKHIPDEFTSVTKKLRRVGAFDFTLAQEAINRCNPDKIVLTFVDYLYPNLFGQEGKLKTYIKEMELGLNRKIDYIGMGTGKILKVE